MHPHMLSALSVVTIGWVSAHSCAPKDYKTPGLPLEPLTEHHSHNGKLHLDLNLDAFHYDGPYSMMVRALNGEIPGPSIRARRGDTVYVKYCNKLGSAPGNSGHNLFGDVNVTNMHTHGLHISPKEPSDNVFVEVYPGECYNYEFEIPDWHQGGTHWYHPHHHGSTSLQVGGGAHGFFFLEDEDGDIPGIIQDVEEVPMIFSHMYADFYGQVARASDDHLYAHPDCTNCQDFFAVNGQVQPVVEMRSSFHKRFRILNAGWSFRSGLNVRVSQNCEMLLLAKDGVYLPSYPRIVTDLVLSNAARADVLVRCYSPGTYYMFSEGVSGGYGYNGPLLTMNVGSNGGETPPVFVIEGYKQKDFFLPYYLEDLRDTRVDDSHAVALLAEGGISDPNTNFTFNHENFHGPLNFDHFMKKNSTQEWTLVGTNEHPFHIHVNHFQIRKFTNGYESEYFRPGDWHDTLGLVAGPTTNTNAVVRFKTLDFAGPVVMHCHILPHEDRGMMGTACIYASSPEECFEGCPGFSRNACIEHCLDLPSLDHNKQNYCLTACQDECMCPGGNLASCLVGCPSGPNQVACQDNCYETCH